MSFHRDGVRVATVETPLNITVFSVSIWRTNCTLMVIGLKVLILIFSLGSAANIPFYKGVGYPWVIKETQFCFNSTLCPQHVHYTWDWFFNTIMDKGAKRFLFGGYSIIDSKLKQDPSFYPPWNRNAFASLKKNVSKAGGSIWLEVGEFYRKEFDVSLFLESANQFIQNYSVDGFVLTVGRPEHAAAAYKILTAVKKLKKTAVLEYWSEAQESVIETKLPALADFTLVYLSPGFSKSLATVFNTDKYAIKMIKDAMKGGAKANKIILRIPLIARADYETSDTGYSSAIFDMHGDPQGNGSIIFPRGDGYYFFSQPRAVDKVTLVKKMGLHGIMIDPTYGGDVTDIYPWDDRSIFHALAQAVEG